MSWGRVQHTRRASGPIEAGSGRHGTRLASVGDVETWAPRVTIFGHGLASGGGDKRRTKELERRAGELADRGGGL